MLASSRLFQIPVCLGLALFIAIAGSLAGCGAKSEAPTAQTKKFRPADEADAQPATDALEQKQSSIAAFQSADVAVPASSAAAPSRSQQQAAVAQSQPSRAPTNESAGQPASAASNVPPQVQQLVDQLNRLGQQQPKGRTQQEVVEDLVSTRQQMLAIGKKILALNPDSNVKQQVTRAMYEVYMLLGQVGIPNARQQLAEFAKSLASDRDPEMARFGRHIVFDTNVSRLASEGVGEGKAIIAEVQNLLDAEKGQLSESTLQLASQAAEILVQSGFKEEAVTTLELMSKAAAADPKLADQAAKFADTAKLAKADLTTLLSNVIKTGDKEAEDKLMAAVTGLFKDLRPSRELFGSMQQIGQILETTGSIDAAKHCYAELEKAYKDSPDTVLAEAAAQMAGGAQKRLALVGQPLAVEGVTLDGKAFDWSAYQGKVVLLDFWATWCQPCLEELPNIQRNFEQFHAKGFEVIGVNLNIKLNDVKEFLSVQSLPWPTIVSQIVVDGNADKDWSQLPMASKCGVDAIPFVVLIGKDGKVDSIHVRGPKLKTRLTQLLGEPITTEVPADPTQPVPPGPAPRTGARPASGKQSQALPPRGAVSPVALLVAQALLAADPPTPAADEAAVNPYKAKPDLTPSQLVAFIQKMLDRPQVIQARPGFADAIVDACDRIIAANPPAQASDQFFATETKLAVLHREACDGKLEADTQLMAFVDLLKSEPNKEIVHEVIFFKLERRVLDAKELPLDEIPALLKEVQEYLAKEKLSGKHLRLASSIVAAINRLESGDERETQFAAFGKLFAKSSDKELARYGKRIAKNSAQEEVQALP